MQINDERKERERIGLLKVCEKKGGVRETLQLHAGIRSLL